MNLKSNLGVLRILALVEGISYISFAITMPMKYILEIPEPNYFVGMAHGFLFIAYILWVIIVAFQKKWKLITIFWSFLASIIPFGTFIADKNIFSKEEK
jgi:integral membrane protein